MRLVDLFTLTPDRITMTGPVTVIEDGIVDLQAHILRYTAEETKECSKCHKQVALSQFRSPNVCKACGNKRDRESYKRKRHGNNS